MALELSASKVMPTGNQVLMNKRGGFRFIIKKLLVSCNFIVFYMIFRYGSIFKVNTMYNKMEVWPRIILKTIFRHLK